MSETPVSVGAPAGEIRGLIQDRVRHFVGLRYAQAPVGPLRFQPPQPLAPTSEPIDGTRYGGRNYQVGQLDILYAGLELPGAESEDCLFLNVYTPEDAPKHCPVVVWIHGGAFISGSGNEYDLTNLVRGHDVVVVTLNYRLGIFGFLNLDASGSEYSGSANLGIQDQIAALQWVHRNIAAFGGDPENVTIWGESAGAASVFSLLGAPAAEGLFHKAIANSGSETLTPPQDPMPAIQTAFDGASRAAALERLLTLSGPELSRLQQQIGFYAGPSLDGTVLTRPTCEAIADGGAAGIPIITGTTRDEGTLLAPAFAITEEITHAMVFGLSMSIGRDDGAAYRAYLAEHFPNLDPVGQMSRAWFDTFRASAVRVANAASTHGAGGWVYDFEVETDHALGITHFADMPFAFDWIHEGHPRLFTHAATAANQAIAKAWSSALMNFARTGTPSAEGLPAWPKYEADAHQSLQLRHTPALASNPDGELLKIYRVV